MSHNPFRGLPEDARAEVLGESRQVSVRRGELTDEFKPYDVHLYQASALQVTVPR